MKRPRSQHSWEAEKAQKNSHPGHQSAYRVPGQRDIAAWFQGQHINYYLRHSSPRPSAKCRFRCLSSDIFDIS